MTEDKERLGIKSSRSERQPATYITIHRPRILDDGYAQLSLLHTKALKGTVRVKFVNEQVCVYTRSNFVSNSSTVCFDLLSIIKCLHRYVCFGSLLLSALF